MKCFDLCAESLWLRGNDSVGLTTQPISAYCLSVLVSLYSIQHQGTPDRASPSSSSSSLSPFPNHASHFLRLLHHFLYPHYKLITFNFHHLPHHLHNHPHHYIIHYHIYVQRVKVGAVCTSSYKYWILSCRM